MANRVVRVAVGIPLKGHTAPKSYNDRMLMSFQLGENEMEQRSQAKIERVLSELLLAGKISVDVIEIFTSEFKLTPWQMETRTFDGTVTYEFNWFFTGEIFVPFAREHLAQLALQYKCDYLFMIDDDMLAPFDLFYKLVVHDKDIVSPLAFTRNPPYNPVIYKLKSGWDPTVQSRYYANQHVLNYPRNELVQCDAVGFGAVLIKTDLFRKIERPWFMSSAETGEDILFCCKAREHGFKIFCDTSVKLGHLSDSLVVTEEYRDQFNKVNIQEQERVMGQYTYETLEQVR